MLHNHAHPGHPVTLRGSASKKMGEWAGIRRDLLAGTILEDPSLLGLSLGIARPSTSPCGTAARGHLLWHRYLGNSSQRASVSPAYLSSPRTHGTCGAAPVPWVLWGWGPVVTEFGLEQLCSGSLGVGGGGAAVYHTPTDRQPGSATDRFGEWGWGGAGWPQAP